jgi:hypothetical protein
VRLPILSKKHAIDLEVLDEQEQINHIAQAVADDMLRNLAGDIVRDVATKHRLS